MSAPLLEVSDLAVRFGEHQAVRGIGFTMGRERLGIVGESGSGKSLTGRAILRLLPPGAKLSATRLAFAGIDLLAAGADEMRALRGRRLALVLQDPKFSLNPLMPVGAQIAEAYRAHGRLSAGEARDRTLAMLEAVRIREPRRVHDLYPHEISGGMGQRAMIAMMLAGDPDLLIAAGLGFLGLGAQPPAPEWGAMIAAGRKYMLDQWWVAAMPGIAIAVVSLGFNLLGDGLRDVLDPKQR